MEANDVIDLAQETLFVMIKMGAPMMIVALVTGLTISFIQALTQIQEMTLSFVPKILATFFAIMISMTYMGDIMGRFSAEIFDRMIMVTPP